MRGWGCAVFLPQILIKMDIKSIKQIVNSDLPIDYQEKAILSILANDKKVIPYIMEILENERKQNKELLLDTNMELSRALITLNANPSDAKGKKAMKEQTDFVVGEIKKHYLKWKDYIKCCFNVQGLP
jgi:hypothetical protein